VRIQQGVVVTQLPVKKDGGRRRIEGQIKGT
jgi:hypothetical protein